MLGSKRRRWNDVRASVRTYHSPLRFSSPSDAFSPLVRFFTIHLKHREIFFDVSRISFLKLPAFDQAYRGGDLEPHGNDPTSLFPTWRTRSRTNGDALSSQSSGTGIIVRIRFYFPKIRRFFSDICSIACVYRAAATYFIVLHTYARGNARRNRTVRSLQPARLPILPGICLYVVCCCGVPPPGTILTFMCMWSV